MDKKKLEKFHSELLKLRAKTTGQLRQLETDLHKSRKDSAGDLSGYAYHMADAGTDAYAQELESNIASGESETLHQIDDALMRIDDGTFGICDMCGEPINVKRLEVMPYACMCIKCQSEEEKAKKDLQ